MVNDIIEGIVTTLSPLHHGGDDKTGSEALLHRMKWIVKDEAIEIPYISGNAIRGRLRRLVFADFINLVDYEIKSLRLYHALFAGGLLESVGSSGKIELEKKRLIRKNIPPISVFGTSFGNQIFEGKLKIGFMMPICKELNDYLPIKSNKSFFSYLDFEYQTRKDDLGEHEEDQTAVQMLINYEVFISGTKFYHKIILDNMNKIEKGVVSRMFKLWKDDPTIGSKSSIGFGYLKLDYNYDERYEQYYLDFCEKNRSDIIKTLEELDAGIKKESKRKK